MQTYQVPSYLSPINVLGDIIKIIADTTSEYDDELFPLEKPLKNLLKESECIKKFSGFSKEVSEDDLNQCPKAGDILKGYNDFNKFVMENGDKCNEENKEKKDIARCYSDVSGDSHQKTKELRQKLTKSFDDAEDKNACVKQYSETVIKLSEKTKEECK